MRGAARPPICGGGAREIKDLRLWAGDHKKSNVSELGWGVSRSQRPPLSGRGRPYPCPCGFLFMKTDSGIFRTIGQRINEVVSNSEYLWNASGGPSGAEHLQLKIGRALPWSRERYGTVRYPRLRAPVLPSPGNRKRPPRTQTHYIGGMQRPSPHHHNWCSIGGGRRAPTAGGGAAATPERGGS